MRLLPLLAVAALVAGCATGGSAPAPVIERAAPAREAAPAAKSAGPAAVAIGGEDKSFYTVKKGDTLYSIALEHGRDYKEVAAWNSIENPNRIQVGQQLRVAPPDSDAGAGAIVRPVTTSGPVAAAPAQAPAKGMAAGSANTETFKSEPKGGKLAYSEQALARLREPAAMTEQPTIDKTTEKPAPPPVAPAAVPAAGDDVVDWAWPAPGKTLATFADSGASVNKGIDIAGNAGEPVHAAGAGKVVYVGNGLRGYGNLVIVRHNAAFLSAYAHNSKILVKEGQAVARGQKIAEIGSSDADQTKLHFEIRHQGKPVDPLKYLPAR